MAYSPRPITPKIVLRRLALWTLICSISAAPSFALGLTFKSVAGMLAGIALFIAIYTIATCTERFERLYRRPFIRSTMYVGYGVRLFASASGLFVWAGVPAVLLLPDFVLGMLSVNVVGSLGIGIGSGSGTGSGPGAALNDNFLGVFLATCIQGALLNVVVFIVMGITYAAQRIFRQWPAENGDEPIRGFEVVPAAAVVPESTSFP